MKQTRWLSAILALLFAAPVLSQNNVCANLAERQLLGPRPANIEGARSYTYKSVGDTDLRLHIFSAESSPDRSGRPALVFFFGGGWNWGRVTAFQHEAEYFAARGMRTILVDYRTYCQHGANIVDEVEDAKSAMRWIRSHADQLGIDPSRIAASGASSGGHLALSTAMFSAVDNPAEDLEVSSRPDLLLLFYPCVDPTSDIELQYSREVIGSRGHEVSPLLHNAQDLPSLLIFSGTVDPLYASDKQFCDQAVSAGNQCEFVEYAGADHGYLNKRSGEEEAWAKNTLIRMERYLVDAAYIDAE